MTKRKRTKQQTTIYKTLHRKLKIEQHEPHLKPEVNWCFGRVSSSCSTGITHRVTLVTNPVILVSHERGKDRTVITTNGTFP
jgi:hypothetical protein